MKQQSSMGVDLLRTANWFRWRAFGLHFLASAVVLAVVLTILYWGWYAWPGYYLVGAINIALIMVVVDVGMGPVATLVVANPKKPRMELRRDLTIIVLMQLLALSYGTLTLWSGRPLFYTYSYDRLEVVPASAISEIELNRARSENPAFAPGLFDRPRWVWAPLPEDEDARQSIIGGAIFGIGKDVIEMPRFYKPFDQAKTAMREQLKTVNTLRGLSKPERTRLAQTVAEMGPADKIGTMFFDGPARSAVAVLDRETLEIKAILKKELKGSN